MIQLDQSSLAETLTLAQSHFQQGDLSQSEDLCRKILAANPDLADAWHLLGLIALNNGDNITALAFTCQAIAAQSPANPVFFNSKGLALLRLGQLAAATIHFRHALSLLPGYLDAAVNLATSQQQQGNIEESIVSYQSALALQPDHLHSLFSLGSLLESKGDLLAAMEIYKKATEYRPEFAEAHHNLACILHKYSFLDQAEVHYQQVLALRPDIPETHNCLGLLYTLKGRYEEAEAHARKALELRPDCAAACVTLSGILQHQGQISESLKMLRRAADLDPAVFSSNQHNFLFILHYDPDVSATEIENAHAEWGRRAAALIPPEEISWPNNPDHDRKLRIGFVSNDFREHSVAFFFKDVLKSLTSGNFTTFCYTTFPQRDAMTELLQQNTSVWRNIFAVSEEQVVDLIRKDEIDILVDLGGHTGENRLQVFAHRAAPIQVTWLGYPDTTGLSTMDYRITDALADPIGATTWHSEEVIRLPEGFLCYGEPHNTPDPSEPPCIAHGVTTFGCFNANAKLNGRVLDLWLEILNRIPNSRLLLKNNALRSTKIQEAWRNRFQERGIAFERLTLVPWAATYQEHLQTYGLMDIALDVFPYNGTTTTCEAMWMGAPVVTLAGDRHVSRVGASILTQVGMEDLIARSPEEYVEKAVALAADRQRLLALRTGLRNRMRGSALGDAGRFAKTMENAFREMWRKWCADQAGRKLLSGS